MDPLSEKLQPILKQIAAQSGNTKMYRSNIEDLLKLYRNIHQAAPNHERFTKINIEKARGKLWTKVPAMENFMLQSGWRAEGDCIRFSAEENLRPVIDLLANERTNVIPSDHEWIVGTKVENITTNDGRDPREERMRRQAAERRDAELAACLKEKEERRLLGENIKRNIRADQEHRRENERDRSHR